MYRTEETQHRESRRTQSSTANNIRKIRKQVFSRVKRKVIRVVRVIDAKESKAGFRCIRDNDDTLRAEPCRTSRDKKAKLEQRRDHKKKGQGKTTGEDT